MNTNPNPTPAAVRFALLDANNQAYMLSIEAEHDAFVEDHRDTLAILGDHIRAVAQEMRKESEKWYAASMKHGGNQAMTDHANDLEKFADRLEGKES